MDKVAMVKQAEVQGVLAGLVDAGYIKLASQEDFDTVCGIVTENISDKDWTFDEVVEKTAEVMDEVYSVYEEQGLLEKEAEEVEYTEGDLLAAIGELTLAKEAGEISDEEHKSKTQQVKDMLAAGYHKGMANKGKVIGGAAGLAALALLAKGGLDIKNLRHRTYSDAFKSYGEGIKDSVLGTPGKVWSGISKNTSKAYKATKDGVGKASSATLAHLKANKGKYGIGAGVATAGGAGYGGYKYLKNKKKDTED